MPDWAAIREEYITGDIGLRTIAEKHSVSFNTLKDRVKREGWGEARRVYRESMGYKPKPKATPHHTTPHHTTDTTPPVEFVPGDKQRENTLKLFEASEMILDKIIGQLIDACYKAGEAKSLTEALLNIKEIQMIKSALDEREQIARIEKLKQEAKGDSPNEDREVEVVFVDEVEGAAR